MSAVLIIGASSAIGSALAQHYLQQGVQVIWLSRYAADFTDPKLCCLQAPDFNGQEEWTLHQDFFSSVINTLQQHQVRLIFNCIGWLHQQAAPTLLPEKSLSQSSALLLRKTLLLNLELPVFYLQGLWPYLTKTTGIRYLQLSAKVGSISDNQLGGWYSYRSAKAALNQWIKTASIELKRSNKTAALVTLHPGTTDSLLSAPFQRNLPPGQLKAPSQTALYLAEVALQLAPEQSGLLLNWDGKILSF
ncbi:MAG: SDR family NAD(P)-dependent oxidoreductase [Gammaproteobacteria bacterium]|nr:SDR family NAD(P)-dependent oxidoreductase [Gammaproteobacteria bacterium]MBU2056697.1 SDR family NAD(P)-dependent oxidoreductase [Gammaproteobacteria bacterium]MBU2174034.1 SDR family NAD(P)-dependent oxidoreductase [Gammaproteobacteria bacterium]MBU2247340.1 SDR family NAD(P)-dependent oxidoreductase [Gammaproteobacteria bacterium]MBU2345044.1 SDR family NAD(P)-dependent oxidoreductase [Gammaproteobacteria bacterium]